jgi:hypothetical protein
VSCSTHRIDEKCTLNLCLKKHEGRRQPTVPMHLWEDNIQEVMGRTNQVDRAYCCWPSPAQSFLVPSPAGLMTTFYSLTTLGVLKRKADRLLSFHYILSIWYDTDPIENTCLPSRCPLRAVSSGSTIPAFRRHVTLLPPYGCSSRVTYRRAAVLKPLPPSGSTSRGVGGTGDTQQSDLISLPSSFFQNKEGRLKMALK